MWRSNFKQLRSIPRPKIVTNAMQMIPWTRSKISQLHFVSSTFPCHVDASYLPDPSIRTLFRSVSVIDLRSAPVQTRAADRFPYNDRLSSSLRPSHTTTNNYVARLGSHFHFPTKSSYFVIRLLIFATPCHETLTRVTTMLPALNSKQYV